MQNDKRAAYTTRDGILKLLSDDEVASVCNAETTARLPEGDEYVDLSQLGRGVRRARATTPPPMGRVLPRKAVHEDTWSKILTEWVRPASHLGLDRKPAKGTDMNKYGAVFIDHKEARIFYLHPDKSDEAIIEAPAQNTHHRHPPGEGSGKEHPNDAKRFFKEVGQALEETEQVLVVGPSTGKLEFLRYLHEHNPALERRVAGVETVDHPTDGQLVAHAKKYFHLSERIR